MCEKAHGIPLQNHVEAEEFHVRFILFGLKFS